VSPKPATKLDVLIAKSEKLRADIEAGTRREQLKMVRKGKAAKVRAALDREEPDVIHGPLALIAEALGDIRGIVKLRHLETIADNLGDLSTALVSLADASAMRVIAEHGSDNDRKAVVDLLKSRLEGFPG
jgi:hypothetical protein